MIDIIKKKRAESEKEKSRFKKRIQQVVLSPEEVALYSFVCGKVLACDEILAEIKEMGFKENDNGKT